MQLLSLFIVALCGLNSLPTGLAKSSTNTTSQCVATSFYDKKTAYSSGIVFKNAEKTHQSCYGHFWNGVNVTSTKNIGLKNDEFGYSTELKGYRWGNITLPGYVGGARNFLLGMQMAMGSASGLLSSSVEKAMYDGLLGENVEAWTAIKGLPDLSTPAGASMRAGILSVWNSTLLRAVEAAVEKEGDSNTTVKRSDLYDWNTENKRQMIEVASHLKNRSNDDNDDDDEQCSATESDNEEEDTVDTGYKHTPEESALYRAPWAESKPVYFYGQCDDCHNSTGFDSDGHGSFQACSLVYQGKEYTGKVGESKKFNYCTVKYEC